MDDFLDVLLEILLCIACVVALCGACIVVCLTLYMLFGIRVPGLMR